MANTRPGRDAADQFTRHAAVSRGDDSQVT